jgi:hypothetical protein
MDANAKIIAGLRAAIVKRNKEFKAEEERIAILSKQPTDYNQNKIRQKQQAITIITKQNEAAEQKIRDLELGAQQAQQEREKQEREKQEREKQEREKQEREKQEREKQERERLEREKQDRERQEREKQERERLEREKQAQQNPNDLKLIADNTEYINDTTAPLHIAAYNYLKEVNPNWDMMTVSLFHILNVQEDIINNFANGLIFRGLREFSEHPLCQPYKDSNMSEYFTDLPLDPLNYKSGVTFRELIERTTNLQTRTKPIDVLRTIDKFRQFSVILEEAINLSYYINHFITKFNFKYMGSPFLVDSETMTPSDKKSRLNLINNAPISFIFHGRSDLYYTELGSHPFILPIVDDYGAWVEFGNGFYTTASMVSAETYGDAALTRAMCVNGKNILKITYGNGTADLYKQTFGVLLKEISSYQRIEQDEAKGTQFFNYHVSKPHISFCANIRSIIGSEIVFLEKVKFNVYISGFTNIDARVNIGDNSYECRRICPEHLLNHPTRNKTTTFYNYKNQEKKMVLTNCERHLYQDVTTKQEKSQFYYQKYLKYKQKYNLLKKHI